MNPWQSMRMAAITLALAELAAAQTVPGMVDVTGNDQTLEFIYALERFEAVDAGILSTHLFFDPYRGDDATGDGTPFSPYRSIAKMKEVCVSRVRCTVLGADRVFSPLTLRMTGITAGENYQRGEAVLWDGGLSIGTVLDWSASEGILVIEQEGGQPPRDGELNVRGALSNAVGNVRDDRGVLNTVGGHVVYAFAPAAVSPATGVVSIAGHSYVNFEGPMRLFSNGTLPAGLFKGVDYTICNVTPNGFRLDEDANCSSPISGYANAGSGMHGIAGAANARVDDPFVPDCAGRDRLCILIESDDPAHPAIIDGNRYHVTGYDNRTFPGLFGTNPDDGLAFVSGSGNGWVGWQNLPIQNVATDAFSNQSAASGKLVALNSPARSIRNGSENRTSGIATNNCYTSHGGGAIVALNGGGSISFVDDALQSGTGACLAPTGATKFTFIGTGTFQSEAVGNFASATLGSTGSDIVIVGHELLGSSGGNNVVGFIASDAPTRVVLARAVLRSSASGGGAAFAIFGGPRAATVRIDETTMHGAAGQYDEALFVGNIGEAGLDFEAHGLLIDDYPLWLETLNRIGSFRNTRRFVLEGYFDDEDGSGGDSIEFLFGAAFPAPTSAATARTLARSYGGPTWSIFEGRSRDGNGAAPGTAWLSDTELLRCQPGEACWGAYRNPYEVPLTTIYGSDGNESCIPVDVLGQRLCALALRGTHIGARGMPDADGDVLADLTEATLGTDPADPDSDDDGLGDGFEHLYGFAPLVPGEASLDPDADGLDNALEHALWTSPLDSDSDADGLLEGFEWQYGFDPARFGETHQDADRDGLDNLEEQTAGTNPLDSDSDGDGYSDLIEVISDSDPLDPQSFPVPGVPLSSRLGAFALTCLLAEVARRHFPRGEARQ